MCPELTNMFCELTVKVIVPWCVIVSWCVLCPDVCSCVASLLLQTLLLKLMLHMIVVLPDVSQCILNLLQLTNVYYIDWTVQVHHDVFWSVLSLWQLTQAHSRPIPIALAPLCMYVLCDELVINSLRLNVFAWQPKHWSPSSSCNKFQRMIWSQCTQLINHGEMNPVCTAWFQPAIVVYVAPAMYVQIVLERMTSSTLCHACVMSILLICECSSVMNL